MSTSNIFTPKSQQTTETIPPPNKERLAEFGTKIILVSQCLVLIGAILAVFGWPGSAASDLVFDRILLGYGFFSLALIFAYFALLYQTRLALIFPAGIGLLFLFLSAAVISGYLSNDWFDSLWGEVSWIYTISFSGLLLLATIVPLLLQSSLRLITALFTALMVGTSVVLLHTLGRLVGGTDRLSFGFLSAESLSLIGSMNDAAVLAGMLFLVIIASLVLLPLRLYVRVCLLILALVSLFLVATIGLIPLWLGIAFVSGAVGLYTVVRRRLFQREPTVAIPLHVKVVSVLLALITIFGAWQSQQLSERIQTTADLELSFVRPSFSASLGVLEGVYQENMWFGTGPNQYDGVWRLYKDPSINQTPFWDTSFVSGHNYMTTVFTTHGLLGGLAVFVFHLYLLWFGARRLVVPGDTPVLVRYLFAATYLSALFLWFASYTYTPSASILLLAALFSGVTFAVSRLWYQAPIYNVDVVTNRLRGFVLLLFVIIFTYVLFVLFSVLLSQYQFMQAEPTLDGENDMVVGRLADERVDDLSLLISVADQIEPEQSDLLMVSEAALIAARRAVDLDPTNPLHHERLASLYTTLGAIGVTGGYASALDTLAEIKILDPLNPKHYVAEARIMIVQDDTASALRALSHATDLKRDYTSAIQLETNIYIATRQVAAGIEAVSAEIALRPGIASRLYQLGQLQAAAGDSKASVAALLRAVQIDPVYADARYLLAAQYLIQEKPELALSQLQLVRNTNPNNAELESLIEQLAAGETVLIADPFPEDMDDEVLVDSVGDSSVLSPTLQVEEPVE